MAFLPFCSPKQIPTLYKIWEREFQGSRMERCCKERQILCLEWQCLHEDSLFSIHAVCFLREVQVLLLPFPAWPLRHSQAFLLSEPFPQLCLLTPDPLPNAAVPLPKVMIYIHFTGVRETTTASAKGLINQLLQIIKGWDSFFFLFPVFFSSPE